MIFSAIPGTFVICRDVPEFGLIYQNGCSNPTTPFPLPSTGSGQALEKEGVF